MVGRKLLPKRGYFTVGSSRSSIWVSKAAATNFIMKREKSTLDGIPKA
jgi:hypothetical protein